MEEINNTPQSVFNLSSNDIYLLAEFGRKASFSYLKGHIQQSFFYTEELRGIVDYFLKEDESETLDKLEYKISTIYLKLQKLNSLLEENEGEDEEIYNLLKNKIKKLRNVHVIYVKFYRKFVRKVMSRYGLLFREKEDTTRIT